MTEAEAKKKIEVAGFSLDAFIDWMSGQTVGVGDDGMVRYYEYDVNRFIDYGGNAKNEPVVDFD